MKDTRIFYANPEIIIISNPENGNSPVVVLRRKGEPSDRDWELINNALKMCGMALNGEPRFREDGLWFHSLKEVGNG